MRKSGARTITVFGQGATDRQVHEAETQIAGFVLVTVKRERMLGVNYDITERKEAEVALKRSKEELEALVTERTRK